MSYTTKQYESNYKKYTESNHEFLETDDVINEKLEKALDMVFNSKGFTPQEKVISHFILRGMQNREMSQHLFVEEKTIKYHITHIYKKLGISGTHCRTLHSELHKLASQELRKIILQPYKIYEDVIFKILNQGRMNNEEYKLCEKANNDVLNFLAKLYD